MILTKGTFVIFHQGGQLLLGEILESEWHERVLTGANGVDHRDFTVHVRCTDGDREVRKLVPIRCIENVADPVSAMALLEKKP